MREGPATAADWCDWAADQLSLRQSAEAVTGFRRALALEPGLARAQFALASLLLDMGDLAGATTLAEQMAAVSPDAPETLWIRARAAMAAEEWGAAREILSHLLAFQGLNQAQAAEAHLSFGLTLSELGDNLGAFAAAMKGKALQRQLYAALAGSRESEPAKTRRLKEWFGREFEIFKRPFPQPHHGPAKNHVFLLGFPRSGTTLLEQLIAAHPDARTLEEEPLLAAAQSAFLSDEAACASLVRLDPAEASAWAEHYWNAVEKRVPDVGGKLFVDKQPAGTLMLPLISRLFPEASILFAIRDPRDVVLSCFRQSFQMNATTYAFTDLADTANCYDATMAFAELARAHLPLRWSDARHEDLVEKFEEEVARILEFLSLAPHEGMSDFVTKAGTRAIRTPSAIQVRAGLNRRGLGRWRQFAEALASVLPTLAPWAARFGYPP